MNPFTGAPTLHTHTGTPVWVCGSGPTVIFAHGVLMDHRMWHAQVAALSGRFRVCSFDMLGHGQGPPSPAEPVLGDFVEQAEEVVSRFSESGAPAFVGFSMGALIAQAIAASHRTPLAGVVLMNAVYARTPDQSAVVRLRSQNSARDGAQGAVRSAHERWFTDDDRDYRPNDIDEICRWMLDGEFAPKHRAHWVFANSDDQTAGKLGKITCPALVMTGEYDGGSTPEMAQTMASEIPGAQLEVLSGQRHMMPVLDAASVNSLLTNFLRSSVFHI
ncbi:MAG: pimeloyl-ACP methyl ester carboxylesterase [Gammaproteobacteria bacterium]|jgi:pimeloyl-ACP methyl ester carboxylesterase